MPKLNEFAFEPFAAGLVAIRTANGITAGAGVLVTDRHVLTCAHVINGALFREGNTAERPKEQIRLQFVFTKGEAMGSVTQWSAPGEDRASDLALLELDPKSVPADARPTRLDRVDQVAGHSFRVLGFSESDRGLQASGVLVGRIANGWVQMQDTNVTGPGVREGFSGSPVWDDNVHGVVGIVVARTLNLQDKCAYLIPTWILENFIQTGTDSAGLLVRPLVVDFGSVDETFWLDAIITADDPITCFEVTDSIWSVGVDSERKRSLIRTADPGNYFGEIIVDTGPSVVAIPLRAEVARCDQGNISWPKPPSTSEVRELVSSWAEGRPFVPRRLLAGDLSIRSLHVMRAVIESVTESMTEQVCETASEPSEPVFAGVLKDVPQPQGWGSQMWRGALSRPVSVWCHDCDEHNTVSCPLCGGRGEIRCTSRDTWCSMCFGRGLVGVDNKSLRALREGDPRFPCPSCRGTGRRACQDCGGSGTLICTNCRKGRASCPRCQGRGRYFTYIEGQIEHTLIVDEKMSGPTEGMALADTEAPWRPLMLNDRQEENWIPDPAGSELEDWLEAQLSSRHQGEILRRVHVEILPVFAVDYLDGRWENPVYLLGEHRIVRAPGLARRLGAAVRRWRESD